MKYSMFIMLMYMHANAMFLLPTKLKPISELALHRFSSRANADGTRILAAKYLRLLTWESAYPEIADPEKQLPLEPFLLALDLAHASLLKQDVTHVDFNTLATVDKYGLRMGPTKEAKSRHSFLSAAALAYERTLTSEASRIIEAD